jgi:hypothetical protein
MRVTWWMFWVAMSASAQEDNCVIKVPLPVIMRSGGGEVEGSLPPGTEVTISGTGERVKARSGASVVSASRGDWLAACAGTLRMCTSRQATSLFSEARSDAAAETVPPQTELHIRRSGKVWAEVGTTRSDSGYVMVSALRSCVRTAGTEAVAPDDNGVVEFIERGEGPGVWVAPLVGDGIVPAAMVDGFGSQLFDVWARSRPDAAAMPASDGALDGAARLREQLAHARRVGMAYVVAGRVFAVNGSDVVAIEASVYDTATNKQLKGVRIKPGERAEWAIDVVRTCWPHLRQANGQVQPARAAAQAGGFEVAPLPGR